MAPPKPVSGKAVNKAGRYLASDDALVDQEQFDECMDTLSAWRYAHEKPLEVAYKALREVATEIDSSAVFGKRLKRYVSIVLKLRRFKSMQLRGMQDIGGCRAVVRNEKRIRKIEREIRKHDYLHDRARFRKKDYISKPKDDGYRGVHLVGKFGGADHEAKVIEIQLRTRIQHYWATALEIIDLFTKQALKTNAGRPDWSEFFSEVSTQFSIIDSLHQFSEVSIKDKFIPYQQELLRRKELHNSHDRVVALEKKLDVKRKFMGFSGSLKVLEDEQGESERTDGYVLLTIDLSKHQITRTLFSEDDAREAESRYAAAERNFAKKPDIIVALVSTSKLGSLREAYPNFFADSTNFLNHLALVCKAKTVRKPNMLERFVLDQYEPMKK